MAATSSKTAFPLSPSPTAIRRLNRDLQKLAEEPIDGIYAAPLEENILEWHYVIRGTKGTAYEGGFYHGKLVFPSDFPWKPPSIYMFTPNGRFLPNQRLCLSISDYHPETWNPGWTVSAILVGLHSFMNESSIATGTETTTNERKKELAVKSASYNLRDATFCKLFPSLVTEVQAAGVQKMSDEQAQEEASRALPRYARGPMANGAEADFLQNARQHMMQMQNEMEAAMRAVMRPPQQQPAAILPDDIYYGVAGGGNVIVQPADYRAMQYQAQMQMRGAPLAMGGGGGGGAVMAGPAQVAVPPPIPPRPAAVLAAARGQYPLPPMPDQIEQQPMQQQNVPAPRPLPMAPRPAAVAVIQMQPQQQMVNAPVAAAAIPAPAGPPQPRRPIAEDNDIGPPPAKRTPDVVTLD